jgi:hypothetical protein
LNLARRRFGCTWISHERRLSAHYQGNAQRATLLADEKTGLPK